MSRWIENQPGRAAILLGNVILYGYQLATAAAWMRTRFPREWKIHWPRIVADVAAGSALPGPLLRRGGLAGAVPTAGGFAAAIRSQEPHRYFLSGWLHGSVLHCLLDCHALARILPPWLETGLGTPLYLTTYLASVLSSNLGHQLFAAAEGRAVFESSPAFHCGASGGICGLYGLLIVTVLRMRAGSAGGEGFGRRRWIGLMWLLLYGSFIPEVSTAGNVSGLVGGALVGAVFGPRYASSYGMKRKWSTEIDAYPRDYRRAMGFANQPRPSLLPLSLLWSAAALLLAAVPSLRSAPLRMIQAILLVP
jgi:membrane associated rhomboid family serine protease